MSATITNRVWATRIEVRGRKLVLLRLAEWCSDTGHLWFYMRGLAASCDMSWSQAQRHVSDLVHEGWLAVTANPSGGAPGTKTHYRLNLERLADPEDSGDATGGVVAAPPHSVDYLRKPKSGRLLKNGKITARLAELRQPIVERAEGPRVPARAYPKHGSPELWQRLDQQRAPTRMDWLRWEAQAEMRAEAGYDIDAAIRLLINFPERKELERVRGG